MTIKQDKYLVIGISSTMYFNKILIIVFKNSDQNLNYQMIKILFVFVHTFSLFKF